MYTGQEQLLFVDKNIEADGLQYSITYMNSVEERYHPCTVTLPVGVFNKDAIVNALVRSKFTQDQVEAITNNRLLYICEYFDTLKKQGSTKANTFLKAVQEDQDYLDLQAWRKVCKQWAEDILKNKY